MDMLKAETANARRQLSLISDDVCYPSMQHMFDTKEQAIAATRGEQGRGTFTDNTFIGWDALYSSNMVMGGATTIAGPSDQDLVNNMKNDIADWRRPNEIDAIGNDYTFWGEHGIWPTGVRQGGLGNCWFLASAAALAQHLNPTPGHR